MLLLQKIEDIHYTNTFIHCSRVRRRREGHSTKYEKRTYVNGGESNVYVRGVACGKMTHGSRRWREKVGAEEEGNSAMVRKSKSGKVASGIDTPMTSSCHAFHLAAT